MSIQAARKRAVQPALEPPADHAAARLLALLLHDHNGGVTIAAMRERAIEAPPTRSTPCSSPAMMSIA